MGEAVSPGSSLLGRESELDVLDRLFDDVHARGGSLEVSGGQASASRRSLRRPRRARRIAG